MRPILLMLALSGAVAACASQNQPLPMVKAGDPVIQLNPDRWNATANDLMTPPSAALPSSAPAQLMTPIYE